MDDAQLLTLLQGLDATTNQIGTNLQAISDAQAAEVPIIQSIAEEMKALASTAGSGSTGISQASADLLNSLAAKLGSAADTASKLSAATAGQIPTLQAIAADGSQTVPSPPPQPTV